METKHCTDCNFTKPISQFNWKERKRGTYQSRCRPCQSAWQKQYYAANRTEYVKRVRKNQKQKLDDYVQWKKMISCCVCDESFHKCLDLHHLNSHKKESSVSSLLTHSRGRVYKELQKCAIVCSNCHRKIHANVLVLEPTHLQKSKEMVELFEGEILNGPVI